MYFIGKEKFEVIKKSKKLSQIEKAEIISSFCRLNTLTTIKNAGSGHIGSSMSAMDLFVWVNHFLIKEKKKQIKLGLKRDYFFSSKGHDVPGFYNVLYSLGIIQRSKIFKLRRLNGLDGHPDVRIPGIEANTGSLGMGISKAKGIAFAKKLLKLEGLVIVLTGDGEFQEGQIYETLQTTSSQKINNIIVIIDHNKIQSSRFVKDIININPLKKKIENFGWHVERCNGNSFKDIKNTFSKIIKIKSKPKLIIADTIKGKGISSIEHPLVMKKNKIYNWHSGAPSNQEYEFMSNVLIHDIKRLLKKRQVNINLLKSIFQKKRINQNSIDIH